MLTLIHTSMTSKCMAKTGTVLSREPFPDGLLYISTIGAVPHICVTHPDLHFIVNRVRQFIQNPHLVH